MFFHEGRALNKQVNSGKTLLVDGPASVTVISGKVAVFGHVVKNTNKIVIREGKRLPFAVGETACFDISLGADATAEEVDGYTIPKSWTEAFNLLKSYQKKPVIAIVLGGVDSGKSSFSIYLANRIVTEKQTVAVLDEDLGQSDIGPPCTVAYAYITKPVTDLFNLTPEAAFFVGATSPSEALERTVEGVTFLKTEILRKTIDFVVVNTDGWAEGDAAVHFKSRLANVLEPDIVFCLNRQDDVTSLCAAVGDALASFRQERVESPSVIKERNRDKRKDLRELGYVKYFANAKLKVWPLKRLIIEDASKLFSNHQWTNEGLLIGLQDSQKKLLGIGLLREIDNVRKAIKVYTSVLTEPTRIVLGKVRLDQNLHEIPSRLPTEEYPKLTG